MRMYFAKSLAALATGVVASAEIASAQAPYYAPPPYVQPVYAVPQYAVPQYAPPQPMYYYPPPAPMARPSAYVPSQAAPVPVVRGWPPTPYVKGPTPAPQQAAKSTPARAPQAAPAIVPGQPVGEVQAAVGKGSSQPTAVQAKGTASINQPSQIRPVQNVPPGVPAAPIVAAPVIEEELFEPIYTAPPRVEQGPPPLVEHRGYRAYARADFLYWWFDRPEAPPLVALDNQVLLGGGELETDDGSRFGGRLTIGWWRNPQNSFAIETSFLYFGERESTDHFTQDATFNGAPLLNIPVTDVDTGGPYPVNFVGAGRVDVTYFSRALGAEANLRKELYYGSFCQLDLLGGFRWFHLSEALTLDTDGTPFFPPQVNVQTHDQFRTQNNFFGAQVGLDGEIAWKCLFLNPWGKFAMGCNVQDVGITGNNLTTVDPGFGGVPVAGQGGILAQTTNIGQYGRNQLSYLAEFGLNGGVQLGRHVRAYGGYTFLFLDNVVRPGQQIDTTVSVSRLQPGAIVPNTDRPRFVFQDTGFLAHGLQAGFELRY